MMTVRRAADRGGTDHGWLDTRHTFSFADYHDPAHMGFRSLRVLNDDRVAPGAGFPRHFHRQMEIVTYVIEGALEHEDSTGSGSVIRPGELQRMSAGTGVLHSEYNPSQHEPVRFLQIWFKPGVRVMAPSYEHKSFDRDDWRGALCLVGSPDGRDGSVTIHQDVEIYASLLAPGDRVRHALSRERHVWLQVVRGVVRSSGADLREGDGAAMSDEDEVELVGAEDAEILLFDLS